MTADGRRWRDYEQAAEAPAPSLDDRRLDMRIAALPLGVDTMTMPVVPAARNGESGVRGGHGPGAPTGRLAGAADAWDIVSATPLADARHDMDATGAENVPNAGDLTDLTDVAAVEDAPGESADAVEAAGAAAGGTAVGAAVDASPSMPEEPVAGGPAPADSRLWDPGKGNCAVGEQGQVSLSAGESGQGSFAVGEPGAGTFATGEPGQGSFAAGQPEQGSLGAGEPGPLESGPRDLGDLAVVAEPTAAKRMTAAPKPAGPMAAGPTGAESMAAGPMGAGLMATGPTAPGNEVAGTEAAVPEAGPEADAAIKHEDDAEDLAEPESHQAAATGVRGVAEDLAELETRQPAAAGVRGDVVGDHAAAANGVRGAAEDPAEPGDRQAAAAGVHGDDVGGQLTASGVRGDATGEETPTATAAGENGRDTGVSEVPGSPEPWQETAHPVGRSDRPGEALPEAEDGVVFRAGQEERLAETAPDPAIFVQPGTTAADAWGYGHPNGTVKGAGLGAPHREPAPEAISEAVPEMTGPGRDTWHEETPAWTADDGHETGEFADADDFWSAVLRDDTERDWMDGPRRPRPLEETRPYGRPGGLAEADPEGQASLAQAVSGRFPDPRGTWIRLINAEGPTEDAFRSNNAVDCALSVMSTWHGEPVVAARRQPEYDGAGRPLLTGETGGVARAEEWLGHRFEYVGHGRRAYVAIAQRLIFGGHGAAAVLITRWAGGGSHAWNAVNCRGEVLWIDAQRGHMAVEPPYEDVTGVFAVVIDRQGRRL
nr:toxin glutamine deamidase domain-containing protein [Microbispora rosea]